MNCYNGEKYLKESLNSIISQTYQNWELIFWDNKSTDQSKNIFLNYKDIRFKYFYSEINTGLGEARLNAYKKTNGQYIAFLDCDDLWNKNKLEKQILKFKDEKVGIVITDTIFFKEKGNSRQLYKNKTPPTGFIIDKLLENYFISLETVLLKKSYIEKLDHSFDPQFNHLSDYDLIIRLSLICKLAYCPEVLAKWRIHDSNESVLKPNLFNIEKKYFVSKIKSKFDKIINNNLNSWEKLKIKIIVNDLIYFILTKKNKDPRKVIKKYIFKDYKISILLLLSYIPLSKYVLRLIKKIANL